MFDFLYLWMDKLKSYLFQYAYKSIEGPQLMISSIYDPMVEPEDGWSDPEDQLMMSLIYDPEYEWSDPEDQL